MVAAKIPAQHSHVRPAHGRVTGNGPCKSSAVHVRPRSQARQSLGRMHSHNALLCLNIKTLLACFHVFSFLVAARITTVGLKLILVGSETSSELSICRFRYGMLPSLTSLTGWHLRASGSPVAVYSCWREGASRRRLHSFVCSCSDLYRR